MCVLKSYLTKALPLTKDIIKWNNRMRETRISELPDASQEFLEGYIPQFIPKNRPVYYWFDVYDIEEQRI